MTGSPHAESDVAVVGAGVIGLACAAALARAGRSVIVLERNEGIARETTTRNSEVVHAGIYYPPGSLKAQLCVRGRRLLYERCQAQRIPHERIGKLIVATSGEEVATLERLQTTGRENGVERLELVGCDTVAELEPHVRAAAALRSPETGIVDAHALALSYLAEAESLGAALVLQSEVSAVERLADRWRLEVVGSEGTERLDCSAVVNAAGLASDRVAELAGVDLDACGYRLHPCKGDYFALAPGAPVGVSRLVYPVPAAAGLGVHATLDLGGRIRFGPDTEYVQAPDYHVDAAKAEKFAQAIARYLPAIEPRWLTPDYAGVRPKLAGPGEGFRDFVVEEESDAGLPGLVNCIGIESPGLTAAPAIAERVTALLS